MKKARGSARKFLLLTLLFFAAACSKNTAHPPKAPLRPLVLVPGIGTTTLSKPNGATPLDVWGTQYSFTGKNLKFMAMNIDRWEHTDDLELGEIMDYIRVIPLLFKVAMHGPFIEALLENGYEREKTLYLYTYDWRNPVPDEAQRLRSYLEKLGETHAEFDVVGISLGTMISLEALADKPLARGRVNELILLGPPLHGSPIAQRALQVPRRKGFKFSAIVPQDVMVTIRSLYFMMPDKKLRRVEKDGDVEFTYVEADSKGAGSAAASERSHEAPWVHPEIAALAPKIVEEGVRRGLAFREKWKQPHNFPSVKSTQVYGSACIDTFGLPGDNTVLAESVDAAAKLFNTKPFWICARHEAIQNTDDLVQNILWNTRPLTEATK
jgi:pimeloyl-ACP methyl ester carboxylesterase